MGLIYDSRAEVSATEADVKRCGVRLVEPTHLDRQEVERLYKQVRASLAREKRYELLLLQGIQEDLELSCQQ